MKEKIITAMKKIKEKNITNLINNDELKNIEEIYLSLKTNELLDMLTWKKEKNIKMTELEKMKKELIWEIKNQESSINQSKDWLKKNEDWQEDTKNYHKTQIKENEESKKKTNLRLNEILKLINKIDNNKYNKVENDISNDKEGINQFIDVCHKNWINRVVHYINWKLYNNRWKEIEITNIEIFKKVLTKNKNIKISNINITWSLNWWDFLIIEIDKITKKIYWTESTFKKTFLFNAKNNKIEWIFKKNKTNYNDEVVIIIPIVFENTWNLETSNYNIKLLTKKWITKKLSPATTRKYEIKNNEITFIPNKEQDIDPEFELKPETYNIYTWDRIRKN